jgi:hypothetical protein
MIQHKYANPIQLPIYLILKHIKANKELKPWIFNKEVVGIGQISNANLQQMMMVLRKKERYSTVVKIGKRCQERNQNQHQNQTQWQIL